MRCKWLICLEFSPQRHTQTRWEVDAAGLNCLQIPRQMQGMVGKQHGQDYELKHCYGIPQFAGPRSVNGMKRDVCTVVPDYPVPAERFRPVVWRKSACSPRPTGVISYKTDSESANPSPRPHPRANASTPRLSRSSPAIPPRFQSSVQASAPTLGM